jgi:peptidoglycan/LPS O-acetylase OafA/YrhL
MTAELKYHTEHVKALDGLRGYAAIIVTFYHAILHFEPALIERVLSPAIDKIGTPDLLAKFALLVLNGATAVLLFYVLSGAVLCQSLLRTQFSFLPVALYIARRILRLFPALVLCMLVMWCLSLAYHRAGIMGFPLITLSAATNNAFLLDTSVHGPSTSVQIEALATPFILFFAFFYQRYLISIAVLLLALSIFAIQKPELVFWLPNMHASVFVFFAGMLVALPEAKVFFSTSSSCKLIILLIGAFVLRHLVHLQSLPGLIAQVMLLAALVGFVRHASLPTRFHHFLENRVSQFLGRISYSYYLLNIPVLFVIWFSPAFSPVTAMSDPVLGGLMVGVIAFALTLPVAYFSHKYCEMFFINLGRIITKKYLPGD